MMNPHRHLPWLIIGNITLSWVITAFASCCLTSASSLSSPRTYAWVPQPHQFQWQPHDRLQERLRVESLVLVLDLLGFGEDDMPVVNVPAVPVHRDPVGALIDSSDDEMLPR